MCCKGSSYFVGKVQYQFSSIGKGNTCCNDLAYDNNTGICCSEYNLNSQSFANNAGPGDTCCSTKPYYKNTQKCCESYISGINLHVYTVADGCCAFGQAPYNKTYQVCCNQWKRGDGDSCCNFNGQDDPTGKEPPDEPYYKKDKCCINGKLYNYACISRGASVFLMDKFSLILSLFVSYYAFK